MNGIMGLVTRLAGLGAVTALSESLLPKGNVFQTVRIGIGLWYLCTLLSEISVILSRYGG